NGLNFRNSKRLITPSPPSEAGGEGRGEEVFSSKSPLPSPLPALRCGARESKMVQVLRCAQPLIGARPEGFLSRKTEDNFTDLTAWISAIRKDERFDSEMKNPERTPGFENRR
ncbi:MAG TPA: hypothetical protein VFW05_06900, partial [Verrucomicrobiae bacterium]|nr:hypothetical protein [Verrucomicrobiae bacterium]